MTYRIPIIHNGRKFMVIARRKGYHKRYYEVSVKNEYGVVNWVGTSKTKDEAVMIATQFLRDWDKYKVGKGKMETKYGGIK